MTIIHEHDKGRFMLYTPQNEHIGEIEYRREGDRLFATHTGVRPEHEGQGLAAMLLDELAAYAMSEGLYIVPICPYVAYSFKKYPERYKNVILPD